MRLFVGAGEASGDKILAALLRELRRRFPRLELHGFGGPLCAAEGLQTPWTLESLAVSGVGDVLRRAFFLFRTFLSLRRELLRSGPDLVLLVDYPGMNVPLARAALRRGIPVHYAAPPQLWAYRDPEKRLVRLRRNLAGASLQTLFPFESEYYAPWASRHCTGHFFAMPDPEAQGESLLLCPGSRLPVLRRNLPRWLKRLRAAGFHGGIRVLVPQALCAAAQALGQGIPDYQAIADPVAAFRAGGRAISFPGTMTLELFLRRIPTRVWAVLDPPTLWAGRRKLRRAFTALPNLLLGREVFPEWVGTARDFEKRGPEFLGSEAAWPWISEGDYAALREKIGPARGVEEGVKACLDLAGATTASAALPATAR